VPLIFDRSFASRLYPISPTTHTHNTQLQKPYMPLGSLRTQLLFPVHQLSASAYPQLQFEGLDVRNGGGSSSGAAAAAAGGGGGAGGEGQEVVVEEDQDEERQPLIGGGSSSGKARQSDSGGSAGGGKLRGSVMVEMLPLLRRTGKRVTAAAAAAADGDGPRAPPSTAAAAVSSSGVAASRAASAAAAAGVSDADLLQLLSDVRLPDLAQRVGGLDAERDWSQMLSLGEQQRVAFARLLLHAPALAVLDESTSALDPQTEAALYTLLDERLGGRATVVSVGHRAQLVRHHSRVLECVGAGRWVVRSAAEYQQQQQQQSG